MLDVSPMSALMKAVPDYAGLLLVGDVDQLLSVGQRQVLNDVIASGTVPVVRLTEVFQQASENRIVVNAHRINAGQIPEHPQSGEHANFFFVDVDDSEGVIRPARGGVEGVALAA